MPRLLQLTTLDAIRGESTAWNDLWQRSDVTSPMARAELVVQWIEQFAPHAKFRALVVEDARGWVAMLPLVGTRVLRFIDAGSLPANSWALGGTFLLDPDCDVDPVLDLLTAGVAHVPWPLLWLDDVRLESASWHALQAAFCRAGMPTSILERYWTARRDIDDGWQAYCSSLSKTMRKNIRKAERCLTSNGEVGFRMQSRFDPYEVEIWLRRGFRVEHRSWKGRSGTSILGAGIFSFYLRQAQELALRNQLHLTFWEIAGTPAAFFYGAVAKGVYHSYKVGYDETFARYSPGFLLEANLFQHLWNDSAYRAVDFVGVFSESQRHWRPTTYRVGRLVVAPHRRHVGEAVVYAHQHWWPYLRQIRRRIRGLSAPAAPAPRPVEVLEDNRASRQTLQEVHE